MNRAILTCHSYFVIYSSASYFATDVVHGNQIHSCLLEVVTVTNRNWLRV